MKDSLEVGSARLEELARTGRPLSSLLGRVPEQSLRSKHIPDYRG